MEKEKKTLTLHGSDGTDAAIDHNYGREEGMSLCCAREDWVDQTLRGRRRVKLCKGGQQEMSLNKGGGMTLMINRGKK